MNQGLKKVIVLAVAAAMAASPLSATTAEAAGKAVTAKTLYLSKNKVSVKVGASAKIKVRNKTKQKIKSVKWSVKKGSKKVKLSGKTKQSVTVQGVKKGTATITAKIKMKTGTVTRKATVTVTKKNTPESSPAPEATPGNTAGVSSHPEPTASPGSTPGVPVVDETGVRELIHYDMTCSDDGKYLRDQSGNGNDAELVGIDAEQRDNQSLFLGKNGSYIKLPEELFVGRTTLTFSIWLKNLSGATNTSAMFVGTKENNPVSYWLLNPGNPAGQMKSVLTNSRNSNEPWTTEVGISPSVAANGVAGPATGKAWHHYVTVLTPDSITGYLDGQKVGTVSVSTTIRDFGTNLAAYIGKSSYPDPTWAGYVREVQVFQGVKTDEEIAQLYEVNKVEEKEEDVKPTGTKAEVFIEDRADPYITLGKDGYYYFTASYPMYGAADKEGYDRIILRRSKTIEGLKTAEEKTIWDEKDSAISHRFIWAPEMHYIGGKWYMYYAASSSASNVWGINCHVLMCEGDDPYNDSWVEKGKFQAADGDKVSFTDFSLDMTYFECNGKSYVIWAQKVGTSNLYMAEVDPAEPWKTTTKPLLLTKPEYYWECISIPVNEGPSVLIHEGRVIVAYSASATGPEYCIGYMYADEKADLMDIQSWTKQETPALTSDDLIEEYGPGHNSFTVDENGDVIFVYHSRPQKCYDEQCGYTGDPLYDPCRSARIRKVQWDENGLPILNR